MTELLVPRRFCGPPSSGNGGWSAGALAALTVERDHADPWPAVTVTLHRPPPLDTELPVSTDDGWTVASHDGHPVARAQVADKGLTEVPPVPLADARAATASYRGFVSHPFPTCFTCGTGRAEGDGLRIFPGDVAGDGRGRVAAPWTPHPSVAEDWHSYHEPAPDASLPVTWAALDCVGGWSTDIDERAMVLGTITLRLDSLPRIGEEHVLVGASIGGEGRKTYTAATLYDSAGAVVATAEHVWITVDPATFG
ncbi:MAG: hypothetical protein ABWZ91_15350 [Nocardioides sp.]|jgi:hypothetical protein